jgi:hypothetical protein
MIRSCLATTLALAATTQAANAVVLYDASLGTSPVAQGLTYDAIGFAPGPYYTFNASGTTLDTTNPAVVYAGFGSNATPLDRTAGFTLRIDAKILSSTSSSTNRAGFSIFALASDSYGIELGFETSAIFAQASSPLFTRAEEVAFATPDAVTKYELSILGSTYTLRADGASLLSGPLRNYTAFEPPVGAPDPYEVPNAIFLGDNTSSASGSTLITYVSVPEPTTLVANAGAGIVLIRRRRH